jgi:hypothetical protein
MTLTVLTAMMLATPTFPSVVAAAVSGPAPSCSVCHQGATMRGTVTTPVGAALRERGLQAGDEASLKEALRTLAGVDSDADGVADLQELSEGADPNRAQSAEAPPLPRYGCATSPTAGALWCLLVVLRTLGRRQSRQSRGVTRRWNSAPKT